MIHFLKALKKQQNKTKQNKAQNIVKYSLDKQFKSLNNYSRINEK